MRRTLMRPGAVLFAIAATLAPAGAARAATSRLTANPPVPLSAASHAAARHPAASRQTSAAAPVSPLPRTGFDLPLELVLAGLLVAGGGQLRARLDRRS